MFKTDKKLKEAAQATAKRMGIPFSAVMNRMMEEFVERKSVTFSEALIPTPYLARLLRQGEKDLKTGKNIQTYDNLGALMKELRR